MDLINILSFISLVATLSIIFLFSLRDNPKFTIEELKRIKKYTEKNLQNGRLVYMQSKGHCVSSEFRKSIDKFENTDSNIIAKCEFLIERSGKDV